MIRVAVPGSAGKMGRMVIEAVREAGHEVVAAWDQGDRVDLDNAQVYIDFTAPEASVALVTAAAERGVAAVIGTTGLGEEQREAMARASRKVPVVWAPNFSLGVNLVVGLVEQAARVLGADFDLEVVEIHHKAKRDAPSGTAIAIAEGLARGRGLDYRAAKRYAREGDVGARPAGEIGVVAVRGGDVVGEHTAHFLGPAERIEITHRAGSRQIFARGAVRAAAWVVGKPPGMYGMRDVLGL